MRKSPIYKLALPVALGLSAVFVLTAASVWDEHKVPLEKVPQVIRDAVARYAPGAKIREVERETGHGRTVWEVEVVIDGRERELRLTDDGRLIGHDEGEEDEHGQEEEREQRVTAEQVPKAALAALRKLAGDRRIVELTREFEHGRVFYEGSWKTAEGRHVDTLVTPDGDLVEVEEQVPAGDVPAAVLAKVRKLAGEDARLAFEKKTMILYEAKFRSKDRFHELLLTPDGRVVSREHEEEHEEPEEHDEDDD